MSISRGPISRRRVAGASLLGAAATIATTQQAAAGPAVAPTGHAATSVDAATAATTPVVPQGPTASYGFQKIRVGVQIKSGAYVPAGTTTAGTVITVTETGPDAPGANAGDCTTQAGTQAPPSTETDCTYSTFMGVSDYTAFPGDTVMVTQKTVEAGLTIDSHTITIGPCTVSSPPAACPDTASGVLTDPGIRPTAVADSSRVRDGRSVVVNVLGNDDTAGAPPALAVQSLPAHGSAAVIDAATATPRIRYRPKLGFHGVDSFSYALRTANGTDTAKVTIDVAPLLRPVARNDRAHTTSGKKVRIHVLRNDHPNGSGALSIVGTSHPHHGRVIRHQHYVVYRPAPGYVGHDRFTYKIRNHGGTDTATVKVTVTGSG